MHVNMYINSKSLFLLLKSLNTIREISRKSMLSCLLYMYILQHMREKYQRFHDHIFDLQL